MNYGKRSTKRRAAKVDAKGTKIHKKINVIICKAILLCILFVGVVGLCSGLGVFKGIIDSAPDISEIDVTPTGYSTTVLASDGTETATLVASGANRKYVTIDEIPQDMQDAFVAIEDSRFFDHNGIDLYGIARAAVHGVTNGFHFNQGASTITQQLIKNNVLTSWVNESTEDLSSTIEKVQRKIQEQYLALELEKVVDNKLWILENYMNSINLGANTLGVQAASERYFGKDVSQLTLSECAVIAGITKNPYGYDPIRFPDVNKDRRDLVLTNMLEQGYISQTEYDEALADDVYSRIAEYNLTIETSVNTYFVDALIDQVYDDLTTELGYSETEAYKAIYQGGLTINSTQDLSIQAIADEEVNNLDNYPVDPDYSFMLSFQVKRADGTYQTYTNQTMLSYYKAATGNEDFSINYSTEEECYAAIAQYQQDVLEEGDTLVDGSESVTITLQPQVALTLMDQYTGQVKALVGGRGDKSGNRTWNRATDTTRQPGSTFKIIGCYAPALDYAGLTLATVQDNAPYTVGTKSYRNSNNSYTGLTTLREGITNSINIVTVKTLEQIGVNVGFEYAEKFGFTTLHEYDKNLGLCLGGLTNGVTNLELTAAYATIADGGEYQEPIFYTTIYDHDGNVLLDKTATQEKHEVIQDTTAWLLTNAMQDVLTSGTGTRAYFGDSMPQAGKTGTTTSNRDSLFAGFTPYYTCVVWGGSDDNSKQISNECIYSRNIWKAIMSRVHENLEYKDFTMPAEITTAEVCSKSGLVPIAGTCDLDPRGSMVYTEFFTPETLPVDACDHHILLNIDSSTGLIANAYCPSDLLIGQVYIIGVEAGTPDADYLATEEFLSQICTTHNASNTTLPTDTTTQGGSTDGSNGTGTGSATDPDSSGVDAEGSLQHGGNSSGTGSGSGGTGTGTGSGGTGTGSGGTGSGGTGTGSDD